MAGSSMALATALARHLVLSEANRRAALRVAVRMPHQPWWASPIPAPGNSTAWFAVPSPQQAQQVAEAVVEAMPQSPALERPFGYETAVVSSARRALAM